MRTLIIVLVLALYSCNTNTETVDLDLEGAWSVYNDRYPSHVSYVFGSDSLVVGYEDLSSKSFPYRQSPVVGMFEFGSFEGSKLLFKIIESNPDKVTFESGYMERL